MSQRSRWAPLASPLGISHSRCRGSGVLLESSEWEFSSELVRLPADCSSVQFQDWRLLVLLGITRACDQPLEATCHFPIFKPPVESVLHVKYSTSNLFLLKEFPFFQGTCLSSEPLRITSFLKLSFAVYHKLITNGPSSICTTSSYTEGGAPSYPGNWRRRWLCKWPRAISESSLP